MTITERSLVVISQGFRQETLRLQPWRYLFEIANQLNSLGWETTIITDGGPEEGKLEVISDVEVISFKTVKNYFWGVNKILAKTLEEIKPSIVVWNLGLTSLAHQKRLQISDAKMIGMVSSPVYHFQDYRKIGWRRLIGELEISGIHLLGTLIPKWLLRSLAKKYISLDGLIFQAKATHEAFKSDRYFEIPGAVIPPGVDPNWIKNEENNPSQTRQELGYSSDETIIIYFGSPAPLRGSIDLIHAFEGAIEKVPSLRLLLLSRMRSGELRKAGGKLAEAIEFSPINHRIKIISGFLKPEELISYVEMSDIVALPFKLVPSDAPISLLEAGALGKTIVTTNLGCLPELASTSSHILTSPGEEGGLMRALVQAAGIVASGDQQTSPTGVRGWRDVGKDWNSYLENL